MKEPEEAESKSKHKKDMIIAKRIIDDSIKDNFIPQVSSRETPNKCLMLYQSYLKEVTLIEKWP